MKKIIAIVLSFLMALSMAACGRGEVPEEEAPQHQKTDVFQALPMDEPAEEEMAEPTEEELDALRQYSLVMEELQEYVDSGESDVNYEKFGKEGDVDYAMGQKGLDLLYNKLTELEAVDKWVGTQWTQEDINWDRQAVLDSFVVIEDVALRETKTYVDFIGNETEDVWKNEWDYDTNGRVSGSTDYGAYMDRDDFWFYDTFAQQPFSGVVNPWFARHYTYDANGMLEKVTYGSSVEDAQAAKTFTYEGGKIVGEHLVYAEGDKINADYRYDDQGRLAEAEYIEGDSELDMQKWVYRYEYDNRGLLYRKTLEKYRWDYNVQDDFVLDITIVTTYTYDDAGALAGAVSKHMKAWSFGKPSEMPTEFTYTCDEQGRPVAVAVSCGDRILSETGEVVWEAKYPACQVQIEYGNYYIYTPAMQ